jgi:hypothetical protein
MMNPALAVGRAMAAANKAGDERKSEGKSQGEGGGGRRRRGRRRRARGEGGPQRAAG